jgi:hypothetical protein
MQPPIASLMQSASRSTDERRLSRLFRALDAQSRQTLLSFAEFLSERSSGIELRSGLGAESDALEPCPSEPLWEPRPVQETVVAAIRRLRRTYPMLDGSAMLTQASSLMAAHVLHGRSAVSVIDELEALFKDRFEDHRDTSGGANL